MRRKLRVLVLGAGVVGTTAAWYLSKAGVEVEVVDRQLEKGADLAGSRGCAADPALAALGSGPLAMAGAVPILLQQRRGPASYRADSSSLALLAQLPASAAALNRRTEAWNCFTTPRSH